MAHAIVALATWATAAPRAPSGTAAPAPATAVTLEGAAFELSDVTYFGRGTAKELLRGGMRLLVERVAPVAMARVALGDVDPQLAAYSCFLVRRGDRVATVVVNGGSKYPERVVAQLGAVALEATSSGLQALLAAYQNPASVDKLTRVQGQLDEAKAAMVVAIGAVLQRGERIEDVLQKSEELSAASREFYVRAKKTRGWCGACVVQ